MPALMWEAPSASQWQEVPVWDFSMHPPQLCLRWHHQQGPPTGLPSQPAAPKDLPHQVGGRLSACIDVWEAIEAPLAVLKLVWGADLEFSELPPFMHHSQASDSCVGISQEKQRLLE